MPLTCALGFHQWEWKYVPDSCAVQLTCRRCDAIEGPLIVAHKEWEWIFPKPNSFVKHKVCKRCKTIQKTDHTGQRQWVTISANQQRKEKFLILQKAIGNLSKSAKLWWITSANQGGVRVNITRQPASVIEELLPYTNIRISGLLLGDKPLFFFPNEARRRQGGGISNPLDSEFLHVNYDGMTVRFLITRFAEHESIPSDAAIAGYTWEHVRVDGSPDRRYNYNPRLPFLNYGQVVLSQFGGSILQLLLSNVAYAQEFANALSDYIRICTMAGYSTSGWTESKQREQTKSAPRSSVVGENPYEVLNVKPSATKDEITAAYRKLALENHPDRVAGLAEEFRKLAERRMKIINAAFEEIKRSRN